MNPKNPPKHHHFAGNNWLVLAIQNNQALLLSQNILWQRAYHDPGGDITWENCTLRKFLNDEYYNSIPQPERNRIVLADIENPPNLWYGTPGGDGTRDHVFLLSLHEADYCFGNSGDYVSKRRKDFDGSVADDGFLMSNGYNSLRVAEYNGKDSWWWLRSPGFVPGYAAGVDPDGRVGVSGYGVNLADGGVRPALWLNL